MSLSSTTTSYIYTSPLNPHQLLCPIILPVVGLLIPTTNPYQSFDWLLPNCPTSKAWGSACSTTRVLTQICSPHLFLHAKFHSLHLSLFLSGPSPELEPNSLLSPEAKGDLDGSDPWRLIPLPQEFLCNGLFTSSQSFGRIQRHSHTKATSTTTVATYCIYRRITGHAQPHSSLLDLLTLVISSLLFLLLENCPSIIIVLQPKTVSKPNPRQVAGCVRFPKR